MRSLVELAVPAERLRETPPIQRDVEQQQQHQQHRKYRGVTYEQRTSKWRTRLYWRGTHVTVGRWYTLELAAIAYDQAAVFVFGEGAPTNFSRQDGHVTDDSLLKRCNFARLDALRKEVEGVQLTLPDEARLRAARFEAALVAAHGTLERSQMDETIAEALSRAAFKSLVLAATRCSRAV